MSLGIPSTSVIPHPVAAPEINSGGAVGGLALFIVMLLIMTGRRKAK